MTDRTPPAYAVFGREAWERPRPFHQISERLARAHPVAYVEFPRKPLAAGGPRRHEPAPGVVSVVPVEFPLQRFRVLRDASANAAAQVVRDALGETRTIVAVLYPRSPLEPVRALAADAVLYHAIDDFSVRRDGTPDEVFDAWEREALEMSDLALAVSEPLAERFRAQGARAVTLSNGYDGRFFVPEGPLAEDVAALPRPCVGFVGTARVERLDTDLLLRAATERADVSFVVVGRVIGADAPWEKLIALPNVHALGPRPFEQVPAVLRALDAAISPYRDTQFDRACSPLKVIEALAMQRPALATPARPDLGALAPHARFASGADVFLVALDEVIAGTDAPDWPSPAAADLSWDAIAARFDAYARDVLAGTSGA